MRKQKGYIDISGLQIIFGLCIVGVIGYGVLRSLEFFITHLRWAV